MSLIWVNANCQRAIGDCLPVVSLAAVNLSAHREPTGMAGTLSDRLVQILDGICVVVLFNFRLSASKQRCEVPGGQFDRRVQITNRVRMGAACEICFSSNVPGECIVRW